MRKRYRRIAISEYIIVGIIVISIFGVGFLSYFIMQHVSFIDHFVIPWAAGRAWLFDGMNPYDPSMIGIANETISGSEFLAVLPEVGQLPHPIINLIFYLPFSFIPYEISRSIWVTGMTFVILLIGFISMKLSGWKLTIFEKISTVALTLIWFPGIYAVLSGGIYPIAVLLCLFSIYLVLEQQDTTAGFILALTIGIFPAVGLIQILVLVWSISKQRWSVIKAYFSGVVFIIVVSVLMLPSWPLQWFGVILPYVETLVWINTPLVVLAGFLPGIKEQLVYILHIGFGLYYLGLLITLIGQHGRIFIWKTSAVFIVSYLFHVQGNIELLFLVMPSMLLMFRFWTERWGLFGRLFSWAVMVIIIIGSWTLFYPEIVFSDGLNHIFLSVGLPILVFMGMVWIRWWALKIPRISIKMS